MKPIFFIAIFVFILSSCSTQSINVTITPVRAAVTIPPDSADTVKPTITSLPPALKNTPVPTSTKYPDISSRGPHLALKTTVDQNSQIVILDADAHGRRVITLPDHGYVRDFSKAFSPDGKWLAFYVGSSGHRDSHLMLYLLSLKDGSTRLISNVIAEGYPQNLEPVAIYLDKNYHNYDDELSLYGWMQTVQWAFDQWIETVSWSPDSRSLAFAGQIDGPSSDVYIYNLENSQIRRLVDDILCVSSIDWSPDGKWIIYTDSIPGSIYTGKVLLRIRLDNQTMKAFPPYESSPWWNGAGWISPEQYLITGHGDGGDPYDIRVLNVLTGQMKHLWPEIYYSYAFDNRRGILVVSGEPEKRKPSGEIPSIGFYFVKLDGSRKKIANGEFDNLEYIGAPGNDFIGFHNGKAYAVAFDGTMKPLDISSDESISVSPDHRWIAKFNEKGLIIISSEGKPLRIITDSQVYGIIWKPDSSGLFFNSNKFVYFVSLYSGQPEYIECSIQPGCEYDLDSAVWLPDSFLPH